MYLSGEFYFTELYTDLTKLIIKIADYIFREEDNVRKGIGDIMGGKVLELESERLKAEGKAIGRAEGRQLDVQKERQSDRFREKLDWEA